MFTIEMETDFLEKLGLTRNESRVYLTLLELGKTNINGMAERLGFHRRTIYDCLLRLEQKGIVSHVVEEKTRMFIAQNPKKLRFFLDEKEEELKENRKELLSKIPQLDSLFRQTTSETNILVYKGKEGLKRIFREILELKPKEYYAFGSTGTVREVIPEFLDRTYETYKKLGIGIKAVVINIPDRVKRAKELNKTKLNELRVMNTKFEAPLTTYIVGKKTILMVWSESNPYAVVFEDEQITKGFMTYFKFLWSISKKPK